MEILLIVTTMMLFGKYSLEKGKQLMNSFLQESSMMLMLVSDYLRARWYDPSSGRFISMDTHPGVVYDPRTLHKYTYCGNNPINHIDQGNSLA